MSDKTSFDKCNFYVSAKSNKHTSDAVVAIAEAMAAHSRALETLAENACKTTTGTAIVLNGGATYNQQGSGDSED